MEDMLNMTGRPVEVTIKGRKCKVRRVPIETIFGDLEADVISQKMNHAQRIAANLDGVEKAQYLAQVTQDLPYGEDLQALAIGQMGTVRSIRIILLAALREDQPDMTEEEVTGLIGMENLDELGSLVQWLCGLDQMKPEKKTAKRGPSRTKPKARKKRSKKR